jgi:hypothetical protein
LNRVDYVSLAGDTARSVFFPSPTQKISTLAIAFESGRRWRKAPGEG